MSLSKYSQFKINQLLFTIYGVDLDDWVDHSQLFNHANDTSSSCQGRDITEHTVIKNGTRQMKYPVWLDI